MNLVKVDPKEFGLEPKNVESIEQAFLPKIAERKELEKVYQSVIAKEISEETCKEAGDLRKKLVKVRTGIAEIHKSQKAFFLASGRFVDAWKNKETLPVEQMEETLSKIEKHFELIEAERLKKLQEDRVKQISPYIEDAEHRDLSSMDDDVWNAYFNAKKDDYLAKIEAEKKAEEERIAEEKRIEEERKKREAELKAEAEKLRIENEKLLAEQKEKERIAEAERMKREAEELERKKKELEKEDELARIQKELEDKKRQEEEARIKAEKEESERIENELRKGDGEKIEDFISDLKSIKSKYEFKSKSAKEFQKYAISKIDEILRYVHAE